MRKALIGRTIAIGVATLFAVISVISSADAGRVGGGHVGGVRGGNIHVGGGNIGRIHTNPGGKYISGGNSARFHTNPGGKYVYRGSRNKFHTNPGGKYAYKNLPGKYHHHYGHYRRYGYAAWYGLPLNTYGTYGGCGYLYRRAVATGSQYWWDRYRRCSGVY